MENSLAVSQKIEHRITILTGNSTPKNVPKRSEDMYKNIHKVDVRECFAYVLFQEFDGALSYI